MVLNAWNYIILVFLTLRHEYNNVVKYRIMMQKCNSENWIEKRSHPLARPYIPLGVHAVGCYRVNRKWAEYWDSRWFAELFWGFEGEGRFQYGNREIKVACGDIFVYFPGTEHRIRSVSSTWKYCWVE